MQIRHPILISPRFKIPRLSLTNPPFTFRSHGERSYCTEAKPIMPLISHERDLSHWPVYFGARTIFPFLQLHAELRDLVYCQMIIHDPSMPPKWIIWRKYKISTKTLTSRGVITQLLPFLQICSRQWPHIVTGA